MDQVKRTNSLLYDILSIIIVSLCIVPWILFKFYSEAISNVWKKTGFCQSIKDKQGYDSFEICFFVDIINAGIMFLILLYFKSKISESKYNKCISALPTIVIHGAVHYYQYFNEGSLVIFSESNMYKYYILIFVFVFLFQSNIQVGVGNVYTFLLATVIIMTFEYFFVPQIYALTYVNGWIMVTNLICDRFKDERPNNLYQFMIIILLCLPLK